MDRAVNNAQRVRRLTPDLRVTQRYTSIDSNISHSLGSGGCRLKYTYAHGVDRLTTIEPLFDTNKNAWEFAVTKKFTGGDTVKGTYAASTKLFGLEWSRDSIAGGSFKVGTTFDLSDQSKAPKLIAESTWNYEI